MEMITVEAIIEAPIDIVWNFLNPRVMLQESLKHLSQKR
jgi:hypothetical protein